MNTSSDNFDRRRFLKGEMGEILHTGLTNTFAQTHYGKTEVKRDPREGGSGDQPIIRL